MVEQPRSAAQLQGVSTVVQMQSHRQYRNSEAVRYPLTLEICVQEGSHGAVAKALITQQIPLNAKSASTLPLRWTTRRDTSARTNSIDCPLTLFRTMQCQRNRPKARNTPCPLNE